MASRKTQFGFMALGCLVGLLGVFAIHKMIEANRAAAGDEPVPAKPATARHLEPPSPPPQGDYAPPEPAVPLPIAETSPEHAKHGAEKSLAPPAPVPGSAPPPLADALPPLPTAAPAASPPPPPAKLPERLPPGLPEPAPAAPAPPGPEPKVEQLPPPLPVDLKPVTPPAAAPEPKAEHLPPPLPSAASVPPPPNELKPIPLPPAGAPLPPIQASEKEKTTLPPEPPTGPQSVLIPVSAPTPTTSPLPPLTSPLPLAPAGATPAPSPLPPEPMTKAPSTEPPLAPSPGPVVVYQVRGAGETMREIARRTLGGEDRWPDVHRLNPALQPDSVINAGASVKLPADACIHDDDSVQPLPTMHPKAAPHKAKVVLPLTGTFAANLDDKKTLLLPRAIRDQLGSCDTLLVSPGSDQCLWLTNQTHLDRLADRLEHSPAREVDVRTFKRLYFAQTEKAVVADDGRVALPDKLTQFAGLRQEVMLVGIDDHFEVWDAAKWRQYTQQKSAAARAAMADRE